MRVAAQAGATLASSSHSASTHHAFAGDAEFEKFRDAATKVRVMRDSSAIALCEGCTWCAFLILYASADSLRPTDLPTCTQGNLVPMYERVLSDQLTPVMAYRALVKEDDREAPSFLFESVVNGNQQARCTLLATSTPAPRSWHPSILLTQHAGPVQFCGRPSVEGGGGPGQPRHGPRSPQGDPHRPGSHASDWVPLPQPLGQLTTASPLQDLEDPMSVPESLSKGWKAVAVEGLPQVFTGGWVGYTGYETVRYVFPTKIPFDSAPEDDRGLPDIHLALYNDVLVFDQVRGPGIEGPLRADRGSGSGGTSRAPDLHSQATKLTYVITWVHMDEHADVEAAYRYGRERLGDLVGKITANNVELQHGKVSGRGFGHGLPLPLVARRPS